MESEYKSMAVKGTKMVKTMKKPMKGKMVKCPKCKMSMPAGAKKCPECGMKM